MRARETLGRGFLLLLAAIPLVPIVAGLVVTSGAAAGAGGPGASAVAPRYIAVAGSTITSTTTPGTNSTVPSSTLTKTSPVLQLPPGPGALVASVTHPLVARRSPGGPRLAVLPVRTEFGSPDVLSVVRHVGKWLGVLTPSAGNGKLAWIRLDQVALSRVRWEIDVSLSARKVTVRRAGQVVARDVVAIGAPASPTPTGRFAVTDRLDTQDPSGPYGCCIVALSAVAPHAIQGWGGGNRIAIHSTPETWSIGQPVSHGCLRLSLAEGRWLLEHVPLGTPTFIRT